MSKLHFFLSLALPAIGGIVLGTLIVWFQPWSFFKTIPPLSPLGDLSPATRILPQSGKQVIGFLPYWLVKEVRSPLEKLDQVVYFSVTLSQKGEIVKRQNSQEVELGWYTLNKKTTQDLLGSLKKQGVKVTLAVVAFDNELIDTLISQPEVKKTAINNIADLVKAFGFDGVNVDFEYTFTQPAASQSGILLAQFLSDLKTDLKKDNPQATISVDIYNNGLIYDQPYNVKALSEAADQVILMAYDFHSPSSSEAGPIAPLHTEEEKKSIIDGLRAALVKGVVMKKVVLGIPLYGYEWPTVTADFGAQALDTGVLATYKRIQALLKEKGLTLLWDTKSLSPWFWYENEGATRQIYFDNEQSIALKLQLVDQLKLQGVAFWALGYEGGYKEVWTVVDQWRAKIN